jgi:hypothetical protein
LDRGRRDRPLRVVRDGDRERLLLRDLIQKNLETYLQPRFVVV